MKTFVKGDLTEIGERGINLSGGQKQRVSLARSAYQEAEIYLLDDPLSAVDSHVGEHIFRGLISSLTGLWKDRTRLLITNQLAFLDKADKIVFMEGGKILETGDFHQLTKRSERFNAFLRTCQNDGSRRPRSKSVAIPKGLLSSTESPVTMAYSAPEYLIRGDFESREIGEQGPDLPEMGTGYPHHKL